MAAFCPKWTQAQCTLGTNLKALPVFKNILKYGQEEILELVTINR